MGRKKIRRGPGRREIPGKDFRLADEVRHIQRRATRAARWPEGSKSHASPVSVENKARGPTVTKRASRSVARDGDPEPVYIEETDTNFASNGIGSYRVESELFVYMDRNSARVVSVFGHPTERIAALD